MTKRFALWLAAGLTILAPEGKADILEVDLAGIYLGGGGYFGLPGDPVYHQYSDFRGSLFTWTFIFDTDGRDFGTLVSPPPNSPPAVVRFVSGTFNIFGFTGSYLPGVGYLSWQIEPDGSYIATSLNFIIPSNGFVHFNATSTEDAYFQDGPCPGAPCGSLRITSNVLINLSATPVPGPIAGAGIPGLLLALVGLLARRRQARRERPTAHHAA